MSSAGETFSCPFCDFKETNDYQLLLHVEIEHSENGVSPFAIKDELAARSQPNTNGESASQPARSGTATPIESSEPEYIECPYKCGEQILAKELEFHANLHAAEEMALEDFEVTEPSGSFTTDISSELRRTNNQFNRPTSPATVEKPRKTSWKDFLSPMRLKRQPSPVNETAQSNGEVRRLGKAELGPHAHERRMPSWLFKLLEAGAKINITNTIGPDGRLVRVETVANETPHLIPVLARLSVLDKQISRAYYCEPSVTHVAKLSREGGFCGYRNTQMLISYIRDAGAPGHEHFSRKRLPTIFEIQDMVESAWDHGFNSAGRQETGGIRGTRKYIGTPEAQALLLSLGIPAEAMAFSSKDKVTAYTRMMNAVAAHFESSIDQNDTNKVIITDRPPLFFQQQGHSMTVVGYEVTAEGDANLIVFDPMYQTPPLLKRLAADQKYSFVASNPAKLMKVYRRDEKYLSRHKAFEMIRVNGPV